MVCPACPPANGLVVAFGDLFGGPKVGPTGPPSEQTAMVGYLSVNTDQTARISLDGELLPDPGPLERKQVRAGRHQLLVQGRQGQALFDDVIEVPAGEHKELHLVAPADPAPNGQPDPAVNGTITAPPVASDPPPVVVKKPRMLR